MKRISILVVILFVAFLSHGQTKIKLEEIGKHIGDSVQVNGKIYSGRWLQGATGRPTLLNMGALYPNQLLTVVIWGKDRMGFDYAPDKELIGKEVWVTGKVELHNDKPQLVLYSQEQVQIQEK
jgi:hypothetical protein